MRSKPSAPAPPAEIRGGTCYPLPSFMSIVNVGRHGLRAMKSRGLRVTYTGNRGFVLGDDFLRYIDQQHAARDDRPIAVAVAERDDTRRKLEAEGLI